MTTLFLLPCTLAGRDVQSEARSKPDLGVKQSQLPTTDWALDLQARSASRNRMTGLLHET